LGRVYTPQVIVNGRAEGVGSTSRDLKSIIEKGSKPLMTNVSITPLDEKTISVSSSSGSGSYKILQVFYEPSIQTVSIPRGENQGRTLPHKNIVKKIVELGVWDPASGAKDFGLEMYEHGSSAILVQDGSGGPIVGAGRL